MTINIAAVSFLNTIPLIDYLANGPAAKHHLRLDLPSRLGALLASGEADVALLPVVEAFRGNCGAILAGTGIACNGAVDSVKLFCNGPVESLSSVLVDRGSRTSVGLLRILLSEIYGIAPEFRKIEPSPELNLVANQGVLVIGDRCFAIETTQGGRSGPPWTVLDLGLAWYEMTGLPFVFAAWAVSAEFLRREASDSVSSLIELLTVAREDGMSRLGELAAREAALGKLGHKGEATTEAVDYYFRKSLRYRLGDEEMAGMCRFHELCIKHGVVPDSPLPLILRG